MMDELLEYGVYVALLVALAIPLSAYINKVMREDAALSRVGSCRERGVQVHPRR